MASRVALLVGNSVYEDTTLARLRTPEADARALAAVLGDAAIGGFDEVESLIDEPEPVVRRAVSRFFHNRLRDDLVLLYFSGHGIKDDHGRLFLAVRDTSYDQLKATAIATSYVTECMDECRSKRQILILDCCNSGAFARGTKGDRSAMTRSTFEGNGYGRVVLTAADSTQYALEGDRVLQHAELSLFTHFLREGLTTGAAARPGESVITLDDWYDYAYEQVVTRMPAQTPRKWVYNQEGGLAIARTSLPAMVPAVGVVDSAMSAAPMTPALEIVRTPAQERPSPIEHAPAPSIVAPDPRVATSRMTWLYWSTACGVLAATTVFAIESWRDPYPLYWVAGVLEYTSMFVGLGWAARFRGNRLHVHLLGAAAGWVIGQMASWLLLTLT